MCESYCEIAPEHRFHIQDFSFILNTGGKVLLMDNLSSGHQLKIINSPALIMKLDNPYRNPVIIDDKW